MSNIISAGSGFSTYEQQDKILVGLSGGVDSSVCVNILKEQGFDVHGAVIRFSSAHDVAVLEAVKMAEQLNIPLSIEDCTEDFERQIITPFCKEYCSGITPSPCVMCNPLIKFKALINAADRFGINLIASGHYARVCEIDETYYIQKAISEQKDQSYMLYRLPQDILSRLCLPVGEFEKQDIRQMAQSANLKNANMPDSQEICFIPNGDYANYIEERGFKSKPGCFIGPKGENLGEHKGILHYTVGQRKGLGIAYSEPLFVRAIQSSGDIQLAVSGGEFFKTVTVTNFVKTNCTPYVVGEEYLAKVRSRGALSPCKISAISGDEILIEFKEPQRAPAPGQSIVFYENELVMGGGVIKSTQ